MPRGLNNRPDRDMTNCWPGHGCRDHDTRLPEQLRRRSPPSTAGHAHAPRQSADDTSSSEAERWLASCHPIPARHPRRPAQIPPESRQWEDSLWDREWPCDVVRHPWPLYTSQDRRSYGCNTAIAEPVTTAPDCDSHRSRAAPSISAGSNACVPIPGWQTRRSETPNRTLHGSSLSLSVCQTD